MPMKFFNKFDQQPNQEPIFFIFLSYYFKIRGADNAPTI